MQTTQCVLGLYLFALARETQNLLLWLLQAPKEPKRGPPREPSQQARPWQRQMQSRSNRKGGAAAVACEIWQSNGALLALGVGWRLVVGVLSYRKGDGSTVLVGPSARRRIHER